LGVIHRPDERIEGPQAIPTMPPTTWTRGTGISLVAALSTNSVVPVESSKLTFAAKLSALTRRDAMTFDSSTSRT
jgi:hypothetical protein